MSGQDIEEGAGAAPTAPGPDDAKAASPATLHIIAMSRWPIAFSAAGLFSWGFRPELPCITCEALRQGGLT
jgi:hypothetical protein